MDRRSERGGISRTVRSGRPLAQALGGAALVASLFFAAVGTAVAAVPSIRVLPPQPEPGQRVTVQGQGFCPSPCSPVRIVVDGSVAASDVQVKADGTFDTSVGLTPVAGTSTLVASQTETSGKTRQATAIVQIVAADQSPTPDATPTKEPPPSATATATLPTPTTSASTAPSASPTGTISSPSPGSVPPASTTAGPSAPPVSPGSGTGEGGPPWPAILAILALAAIGIAVAVLARRRSVGKS
jgi:hypothetical protein